MLGLIVLYIQILDDDLDENEMGACVINIANESATQDNDPNLEDVEDVQGIQDTQEPETEENGDIVMGDNNASTE